MLINTFYMQLQVRNGKELRVEKKVICCDLMIWVWPRPQHWRVRGRKWRLSRIRWSRPAPVAVVFSNTAQLSASGATGHLAAENEPKLAISGFRIFPLKNTFVIPASNLVIWYCRNRQYISKYISYFWTSYLYKIVAKYLKDLPIYASDVTELQELQVSFWERFHEKLNLLPRFLDALTKACSLAESQHSSSFSLHPHCSHFRLLLKEEHCQIRIKHQF